MSVTDDALKAKFSTLSETQDSIVSVANWMMFHRRHADRVVQAWFNRLRDIASPKRLNLVYLANEVVQQSRLRHRTEFPDAFSPIIADAVQFAYKGNTTEVQQKLRRNVEVWRDRKVFEGPIVDAIEARLDDIDKSRGSGKKPLMGGSLFSTGKGSVPKELEGLVPLQTAVSKASLSTLTNKNTADAEYEKLNGANAVLPSPPVHAARLSALMKALANAESSVNESIKARTEMIAGLEKILESNKADLSKDEALSQELSTRRSETEAKKRDVEDSIMRGMSDSNATSTNSGDHEASGSPTGNGEPERPDYEALTPPPVEALTPPSEPTDYLPQEPIADNPDVSSLLAAMAGGPPPPSSTMPPVTSSLVRPRSSSSGLNGTAGSGMKKRKMSHEEDIPGFAGGDAMEGLDEDVAELLKQESSRM